MATSVSYIFAICGERPSGQNGAAEPRATYGIYAPEAEVEERRGVLNDSMAPFSKEKAEMAAIYTAVLEAPKGHAVVIRTSSASSKDQLDLYLRLLDDAEGDEIVIRTAVPKLCDLIMAIWRLRPSRPSMGFQVWPVSDGGMERARRVAQAAWDEGPVPNATSLA